jgi:hypothetical protein
MYEGREPEVGQLVRAIGEGIIPPRPDLMPDFSAADLRGRKARHPTQVDLAEKLGIRRGRSASSVELKWRGVEPEV